MSDAKNLFEQLKRRLDPTSRRAKASAAPPPETDAETLIDPLPVVSAGVDTDGQAQTAAAGAETAESHAENTPHQADTATFAAQPDATPDAAGGAEPVEWAHETSVPDTVASDEAVPRQLDPEPEPSMALANPAENSEDDLSAAPLIGRPEIFDAMAREIEALASEIDEKRAEPEPAPAIQPKGGNLLADVRALAAGWFRNGRKRDAVNAGPGELPTPEELVAAGEERGVDVTHREVPLRSLEDKDFPCIALDKDGGSHVLTGREGKTSILVKAADGTRSIATKVLESAMSGVVFFVRPKPERTDETPETEAKPKEGKLLFGVFGKISAEMFATQRPLLWQLALATGLSNLFTIALPLFSMAVYDRVVPHLAWETLWALSIGVMIILATDFAIRYIRMKLLDAAGLSVATSLQARLYSRIVHGRVEDVPKASGGLSSGFREVEALCHVLPALAIAILVDMPFFVLAGFLIYSIGGLVAVTPFIGALILAAVHIIGHFGEDAARKYSRFTGVQSNVLLETIGALESVKLMGGERMLLRRWERLVDSASHASHINRLQGNFAGQASVVVSQAVTVIALIIGVYEISTGAMTVGALSASTLLIGRMMTPVSQLMGLLHRAHQLSSAAQTMERIFKIPMENAGDSSEIQEERPIVGHLSFKNASFTYPGEQTPCLTGISIDIKPGEKIGLIGRVGSGKSTLLRLILRMYDTTSGTILLDQQEIRQVNPRVLRRHFGFMRQDSVLFDDTLQANICFGLDSLKMADFERAVTLSGVKDFAARHPSGFGMKVGPRGERLSGGERQSVSMARLLAENPPAMIFDEPTAAMDNALEAKVVRELRDFSVGKTLIIATHRAPLLALVDRIIWLEGGRIIADGSKDEVMKRLTQTAA